MNDRDIEDLLMTLRCERIQSAALQKHVDRLLEHNKRLSDTVFKNDHDLDTTESKK